MLNEGRPHSCADGSFDQYSAPIAHAFGLTHRVQRRRLVSASGDAAFIAAAKAMVAYA